MKWSITKTEFFKIWRSERDCEIRILKDAANLGYYTYQVQRFNGRTWEGVRAFHTLAEAKAFAMEV